MSYFYLHPFKPQYFFPEGFKKHDLFLNFFTPYTLKGKISWYLFNKLAFYRFFFYTSNIESSIPESKIRSIVGKEPIMAFNKGTFGPEQKITALGIDNNNEFFIKYGQTDIAIKNIMNEKFILNQLANLDFVPKILDFYVDSTQVLLKTNVLKGKPIQNKAVDKKIIDKLILFSKQNVDCHNFPKSNFYKLLFHMVIFVLGI